MGGRLQIPRDSAVLRLAIAAVLVLGIAVIYAPLRNYDFVRYDDPAYVADNDIVKQGLSAAGVRYAFTETIGGFWQPLATLSHMTDCRLFGTDAGRHHLVSVAFHVANTLLLFGFLAGATGAVWTAALAAALFAFHPMNVESVAWIAERKNVLCTFFCLLTLWAYRAYAARPGAGRYVLVAAAFAAALLSKPMAVTLPFALLLLDVWPLRRTGGGNGETGPAPACPPAPWSRLLIEKAPLVVLALAVSAVTYATQRAAGAIVPSSHFSFPARIGYALVNYVRYLDKLIWPHGLAVLYPRAIAAPPLGRILLNTAVLALLTAGVAVSFRRSRYLLIGWLWFLGTLVPVIGLVLVGYHDLADRFVYIPAIGIFVMAAWGLREIAAAFPARRLLIAAACAAVLAALAGAARVQAAHWRDSQSLFEHALKVTRNNYIMHDNFGRELAREGKLEEAASHFAEAVYIMPAYLDPYVNLAVSLFRLGRIREAVAVLTEASRAFPNNAQLHCDLGIMLAGANSFPEAAIHLQEAIRLRPDLGQAHYALGMLLFKAGQKEIAKPHLEAAAHLLPGADDARRALEQIP